MNFDSLLSFMKIVTFAYGIDAVLESGIASHFTRNPGPLYIAEAIIVAGPLESILKNYANDNFLPEKAEKATTFVDYLTSLGFIILLNTAIKCYRH